MAFHTIEENLLLWIHDKREVEDRHASTLARLISFGWVTATRDDQGKYSEITITPEGRVVADKAIFSD